MFLVSGCTHKKRLSVLSSMFCCNCNISFQNIHCCRTLAAYLGRFFRCPVNWQLGVAFLCSFLQMVAESSLGNGPHILTPWLKPALKAGPFWGSQAAPASVPPGCCPAHPTQPKKKETKVAGGSLASSFLSQMCRAWSSSSSPRPPPPRLGEGFGRMLKARGGGGGPPPAIRSSWVSARSLARPPHARLQQPDPTRLRCSGGCLSPGSGPGPGPGPSPPGRKRLSALRPCLRGPFIQHQRERKGSVSIRAAESPRSRRYAKEEEGSLQQQQRP